MICKRCDVDWLDIVNQKYCPVCGNDKLEVSRYDDL